MTDAQVLIAFGAALALLLAVLLATRGLRAAPKAARFPPHTILVDGSNVMHWGGDPSEKVLFQVVGALRAVGLEPVVVFDANVGYKLGDRFLGSAAMATRLGLPHKSVFVVDSGVIADEVILKLAQEHGLRVVSNDRFRDWRVQFPQIARRGALVRGSFTGGRVVWAVPDQVRREVANAAE